MSDGDGDVAAPVPFYATLTTWKDVSQPVDPLSRLAVDTTKPRVHKQAPFTVNQSHNESLKLWRGSLLDLDCAAVVVSNNEQLTDRAGITGAIVEKAGPELLEEIATLDGCSTGAAKMTQGYNTKAQNIIFAVAPKYLPKFDTAAQNALNSCYRNALQVAQLAKIRTIAFSVLHSERRGFPMELGCHVALRTLRKYMDVNAGTLDTVILCTHSTVYQETYERYMPLYFPRSKEDEDAACWLLPSELGNESGEVVLQERTIRIDSTVARTGTGKLDIAAMLRSCPKFIMMSESGPETKTVELSNMNEQENIKRYQAALSMAKKTDLSGMSNLGFLYQAGKDKDGRPVVVVVGKYMPVKADAHKVLLYLVSFLDSLATREYVILYVFTGTPSENEPDTQFLKLVLDTLHPKVRKNMKNIYVLHGTFLFKAYLFVATPFLSARFWQKLLYIDDLVSLDTIMPVNQLRLPSHIIEYDFAQNSDMYAEGHRHKFSANAEL